jgi:hypothetical protein
MLLLNLSTMTTISDDQFRANYPTTSFPNVLTPDSLSGTGYAIFSIDAQPADTAFYSVIPGAFTGPNADGTYTMGWSTESLPLAQIQSNLLSLVSQQKTIALGQMVTVQGASFALSTHQFPVWQSITTFPTPVKSATGQWVQLQQADIQTLMSSITSGLLALNANEFAHYTAIMALAEGVSSYDVTTGWTL